MRVLNELPVEIKRVGVFVNEGVENILRTTRKYGLAYVQLHGDESPEQCNSLRNSGIKVIKAIHVENRRDIETAQIYHGYVDPQDILQNALTKHWQLSSNYPACPVNRVE